MEIQRIAPTFGKPVELMSRHTPLTRTLFRRDEHIFSEGEAAGAIYVVRHGCVRLDKRLPDGRLICLGFLGAGTVFVQEDTRDGIATGVMATALVDAAITIVQNGKLIDLLKREPGLASALVAGMAHRQTELQTLVQHLMVRDAGVRLAATLLGLGDAIGKPLTEESLVIASWYSHQELANMAGINRVTVTRKLRHLCRLGHIEKIGRRQLVIYPERLRSYIHEHVD